MSHVDKFFNGAIDICNRIDAKVIDDIAEFLRLLRERSGRLFILGVGGSAGNASHAVNDFRKLCGIEAYAPTDNVSELTARTNDEGWETVFSAWLTTSKISKNDAVLIFSVGGGSIERNVSMNIVKALELSKHCGATIIGIVGRDGGYTAKVADYCVIIPVVDSALVTPHAEAFQAVVWHCLVSHPSLQIVATKW